jgi:hypothetical protein
MRRLEGLGVERVVLVRHRSFLPCSCTFHKRPKKKATTGRYGVPFDLWSRGPAIAGRGGFARTRIVIRDTKQSRVSSAARTIFVAAARRAYDARP